MNCGRVSARSFAPFLLRTCMPIFTKLRMKVTPCRIYESRASNFLKPIVRTWRSELFKVGVTLAPLSVS